ncbi:MAG: tetratricopeptide repeat protein, partial [Alphaproteobacteria bacterium]
MVSTIVVAGTSLSAREALDHAAADHRAGRLEDAEQVYNTILEAEPDNIEALYGLGLALLGLGVPDQAVQIFRRSLKLAPDQAVVYHPLGNALGACREFEEAASAYRQALEIDPEDAASAFELGNILADLGALEDAVAAYRRVLDIDADHIDARCHLGTTLKDLGRFDEAEAVLSETLRRQPHHAKAHTQLGLTLVAKGRIEDAAEIILAPVRRYRAVAMVGPATAPNFTQDFDRVNRTKIRHDIEQISYLLERGRVGSNRKKLLGEYQAVLERVPDGADLKLSELSPPPSAVFKASYNRMVHFDPPGVIEGGALNPELDFAAIEAEFFDGAPAFACIDDLLSADALAELRRFCMESTIWFQMTFSDELGTSMTNGFSCPLLFQISNQLRANLPNIFGDNQLKFCWAYKYYKNLSGL